MNKIKYVVSRVANMDYKQMYQTAKIVHKRTGKFTPGIMVDMIRCGMRYMAGYMDYLVFEFYNLNEQERATYITRGENNKLVSLLNKKEDWPVFEDKTRFNETFAKFLGRQYMDLRNATAEEFADFLKTVKKIVVKPIDGTCGRDIEILPVEEITDTKALYERLKAHGQYMVDEFVQQADELAEIYPLSLNTIRLVTIVHNGVAHLVFSSIRVGNGKIVDNLNSGGMATIIDPETGIITKPAADKDGKAYEIHPFTKKQFVGTKIPRFDEAVAMVKEAALVVDGVKYVGWDVAITNDKVLLIEANHFPGHDIYQFQIHLDNKIGLLPRFRAVLSQ